MSGPVSDLQQRFLMARMAQRLSDHGVSGDHDANVDRLIELHRATYPAYSFDELLLRPRVALLFCDRAREMFGEYDLPDDIILRSILNRRKNP